MVIQKVLMIDDEADIRTVGTLSLEKVGKWSVVTASSGSEGLAQAASEKPDVILLDVMMPGMDGIETFEALRADTGTAGIPVIFMTAKVQRSEVQQYLDLGARGVISKPFDPMSLPDEIRGIVAAG